MTERHLAARLATTVAICAVLPLLLATAVAVVLLASAQAIAAAWR